MGEKDRILLVEDSRTQAVQLVAMLEAAGWDVVHAATAEAAMEFLSNELPQLILVDFYLPGIRGDELCRQIRMRANARPVPVAILTGDTGQETELRGLESGADDFISKSVGEEVLLARLRGLLARSHRTVREHTPSASEASFRAARLLAVDDSRTYLTYLTEELRSEWPCIETASSGAEALERLAKEEFDCVLVDLVMPDMDGIAVCRRINELHRQSRLSAVVLMLTSKEDNECLSDALAAGADDFVGKSSDIIVVKGRIRALLRRKFYEEEHRRRLSAELRERELKVEQERIQREAAELAARTQLLSSVLEHIPHRVFWKDRESVYLGCNESFARDVGLSTSAEIAGKTDHDLSWPRGYADACRRIDRDVMSSGVPLLGSEEIIAREDGGHTWLLSGRVPLRAPDGTVNGLLGLQVDISDQKRVEEELRAARDQAWQATKARSEFLANMSHELRTPLNGVIGMVDVLLQTSLDSTQKRFAGLAKRSGEALLSLINDVLDFSKIDAGKLDIVAGDFHLHHAIEETVEVLSHKAGAKGLELACCFERSVPAMVRGDRDRLRQVLLNLINNAVKFTERGSVVLRVALEEQEGTRVLVRVSVTDTGIGIAPDRIDRLFKAFSQADSSTTRLYGGTGLGLAIAKQLVELMGGTIRVESTPGAGSTFSFTIAFEAAAQPQDAGTAGRHVSSPLRALVVDGSEVQRDVLVRQLSVCGFQAVAVPGPRQALESLSKAAGDGEPFGFVVVDSETPPADMSAFELAAAVRGRADLRSTVLMLMRPLEADDPPDQLRRAGFAGLITKPVCQSRLYDTIMSVVVGGGVAPRPAPLSAEAGSERVEAAAPARPHGLRVLIAEDNEINQIVAVEILTKAGYCCEIAGDGAAAVAAVKTGRYSVVLMDCQMPVMDGFDAAREIRRVEEASGEAGRGAGAAGRLPIVALTANAMKGDREKCLEAGMDAYISKPINPRELLGVLDGIFSKTANRAAA